MVYFPYPLHPGGTHPGIVEGLKDIHKEGGWRSFFRGNGTNVIKIAPESACEYAALFYASNLALRRSRLLLFWYSMRSRRLDSPHSEPSQLRLLIHSRYHL